MKKGIKYLLSWFWILGSCTCYAQSEKIDSLLTILKTANEDTLKVNIFNDLFLQYEYENDEKAKEYLSKALKLAQKNDDKKGLVSTFLHLGFFEDDKGNYPEALKNYSTSFKIAEGIGDKKGEAYAYSGTGIVYDYLGNYPEALKNYLASLKIYEAIGDKKGIAESYNNIGIVYYHLRNYPEGLKNIFACLEIMEKMGNKKGISDSYGDIGGIYDAQGNYPEALKNELRCLMEEEEIGDKAGISVTYNDIGLVYFHQAEREEDPVLRMNKLTQSLKNYFASLKMKEVLGDKGGIAASYSNVGIVYIKQKNYKEAEEYLIKAKELSKEIGSKEFLRNAYSGLTELDSAKGNYRGAYENHKLYILYRDSLDNEETRKKTIQNQMTYDFEKKEAVADAEHKKELENQEAIAEEKSRKQKVVLILVSGFLALVLFFAGFIFRSLRLTRKQKIVIEEQKELVEEKQKEILDSIYYARRIQRSLLPTEIYIEKSINRLKRL